MAHQRLPPTLGQSGSRALGALTTGADNFHVTDRFAILNLKAGGVYENPSLDPQFNQGYVLQRRAGTELIKAGKHAEAFELFKTLTTSKVTPLQQADALELAIECAVKVNQLDAVPGLIAQIKRPFEKQLANMRWQYLQRQPAATVAEFPNVDWSQWPDTLRGAGRVISGTRAPSHGRRSPGRARSARAAAWTTDDNTRGEALLNWGRVRSHLLKDDTQAIEIYRRVYGTRNEFKQCNAAIAIADIFLRRGTSPLRAQNCPGLI